MPPTCAGTAPFLPELPLGVPLAALSLLLAPAALAQSPAATPPAAAPAATPTVNPPTVPKTPGNLTPPVTQPGRIIPPPAQQPPTGVVPLGFSVHGSLFERYREDTNQNSPGFRSRKEGQTYGNIRPSYTFNSLLTVQARVGFELETPGGGGRDYNGGYYPGTNGYRGVFSLDQGGLIYHDQPHGLTINAGRQSPLFDVTATIFDSSFKVGNHVFLDGVSVVQQVGPGTIQGYALSEDQYRTKATRNGLYVLRGTYTVQPPLTVALMLAHYASSADNTAATGALSTTNYEADAVYKLGRAQYTAEYARSSASSANELYFLGVRYGVTTRDTVVALGYQDDLNGDIGRETTYDNNARSLRFVYEHAFNTSLKFITLHEGGHHVVGPGTVSQTEATLLYSF